MAGKARLLLGISVFWLALSMLFDGLNTLVLPSQVLRLAGEGSQATALGLLTFAGLLAGMLVQPVAGLASDRLRPRWGRRGVLGVGMLLILGALALLAMASGLVAVLVAFTMAQVAASVAQAAQQGFIPDLVPARWRGTAAGLKGFMDVGGALLAFALLGELLRGGSAAPALAAIGVVVVMAYALTVALVREPGRPVAGALEGATGARLAAATLVDAYRLDVRRHRAFTWLVASRFLFLLGTYAVGRFFLFFVNDRLGLGADQAAGEAGMLLAGMTLVTILAAPPAGWAADRFGRLPLMLAGAGLSGLGVLSLMPAGSALQILLGGGLMALGSAAFTSANWAFTADQAPEGEGGRFLGLANFGTAGAAAAAGLFGPLVDWANAGAAGAGYTALLIGAALAFLASALALRPLASPGSGARPRGPADEAVGAVGVERAAGARSTAARGT